VKIRAPEYSELAGCEHNGFDVGVLRSGDQRLGKVLHKHAVERIDGASERTQSAVRMLFGT
jgi:hypothetical protein